MSVKWLKARRKFAVSVLGALGTLVAGGLIGGRVGHDLAIAVPLITAALVHQTPNDPQEGT